MKKSKIIFSVIMAVVMICVSVVPAFAMTEDELTKARWDLNKYANTCEDNYIYYNYLTPVQLPIWSKTSQEQMAGAIEKVRSEVDTYETEEEFSAAHALLDEAVSKMYVSSKELQWMIDYLAKDYNSQGFYDEETMADIKTIYEEALVNVQGEDELKIHHSYIDMRNLLNRLCLYNNPVMGDVNKDGELNIVDVALMQMELAQLNEKEFTSAQRFAAYFSVRTDITTVTDWQLALAKLNNYEEFFERQNGYLKTLSNFPELDRDTKEFTYRTEDSNIMYYYDQYTGIC